jgi:Domain of unknown function (DUF6754)
LNKTFLISTFIFLAACLVLPVYAQDVEAPNSVVAEEEPGAEGKTDLPGAGLVAPNADEAQATPPISSPPLIDRPLPPNLRAEDAPNDGGWAIHLLWDKFPDGDIAAAVTNYKVLRKRGAGDDWEKVGETKAESGKYVDSHIPAKDNKPEHFVIDGVKYSYKLRIIEDPAKESEIVSAVSKGQWLNTDHTIVLIATLLYVALVVFFIQRAKHGPKMYVRPIPGINAVEDAVGRATEMGKPVLYVPGIGVIEEIATLAAMTILSPIAEKVAEYGTPLLVPNRDPVVYSIAQEVVRQAYIKVGKPDAYVDDNIFFLSGRQFAYAAGVAGIMMREKPATNFFFGAFYAESLILAETGAATGAIQIAGTDQVTQLPFFIAACDYTLLGEELYAASAYLSDDPVLVGSLKALDYAKILIFALMGSGFVAGLFGWSGILNFMKLN